MHLDPLLLPAVELVLGLTAVAVILRALHQPHVIAYLFAGIVLGPSALGVVEDIHWIERIGNLGVILLLFFVGMEVSPQALAARWRIPVLGTLAQVMVSVAFTWVLGRFLGWSTPQVVLFGFVISLSSTAVVLRYLGERQLFSTPAGQDALGVLLVQDILVIPMLLILEHLGQAAVDPAELARQGVGALIAFAFLVWLVRGGRIHLPFSSWIRKDHELQVFVAILVCLGSAAVTGLLGLSTALGAFLGGLLVGAARETQWVHHSLSSFYAVSLALFFVAIGMLIDLDFALQNAPAIIALVIGVLVTNTFINALIVRLLGADWPHALYVGGLLGQIGEFSFLLVSVGHQSGFIDDFAHQLTLAVITLSLILSPAWIALTRRLTHVDERPQAR